MHLSFGGQLWSGFFFWDRAIELGFEVCEAVGWFVVELAMRRR